MRHHALAVSCTGRVLHPFEKHTCEAKDQPVKQRTNHCSGTPLREGLIICGAAEGVSDADLSHATHTSGRTFFPRGPGEHICGHGPILQASCCLAGVDRSSGCVRNLIHETQAFSAATQHLRVKGKKLRPRPKRNIFGFCDSNMKWLPRKWCFLGLWFMPRML